MKKILRLFLSAIFLAIVFFIPQKAQAMGKMGVGLGWNRYDKTKVEQLGDVWVYNWDANGTINGKDAYGDFGDRYVPMQYNCGSTTTLKNWIINNNYQGYVLVFNEPENTGEAGSSCETYPTNDENVRSYVKAAQTLKDLIDWKAANSLNIQFIIGGVGNEHPYFDNKTQDVWFSEFFTYWQATYGSAIDIAGVHLHVYPISTFVGFKSELDTFLNWYHSPAASWLAGKEIWITEMGFLYNDMNTIVNKGVVDYNMPLMLNYVQNKPEIKRYAWFSFDRGFPAQIGDTVWDDTLLSIDGAETSTYYIFQHYCAVEQFCNPNYQQYPNLLLNGYFQKNLSNWKFASIPSGIKKKLDKSEGYSAPGQVKVSVSKTANATMTSNFFKLDSNATYVVRTAYRIGDQVNNPLVNYPLVFEILKKNTTTNPVGTVTFNYVTTAGLYNSSFTTGTINPADFYYLRISANNLPKNYTISLDDIEIRKTTAPLASTLNENYEEADYTSWLEKIDVDEPTNFYNNLLLNPFFPTKDNWTVYTNGGDFNFSINNDEQAYINVIDKGTNTQFYQSGISIEQGKKYRVGFDLKGNISNLGARVKVIKHASPYNELVTFDGTATDVLVNGLSTTEMTQYLFDFTATATEPDARLQIFLTKNGKYYFDNMVLEEVDPADL